MQAADGNGPGRTVPEPQRTPRPPDSRPSASAFGRPAGVPGSFAPGASAVGGIALGDPPLPAHLSEAFGRPSPDTESLQRPRRTPPEAPVPPPPNPWRNPAAPVALTPPHDEDAPADDRPPAERFTLREALFQRRLRLSALIGMLVAALVIGAVGAVIGVLAANRLPAAVIDPDATLTAVDPGVVREPGSVSEIAARVTPAVVSLEIRAGDTGDTGSGVVIDPAGYVLTNNHVISSAATNPSAQLTVVFADAAGTRVPGTIVGRDPLTDLAVVKVDVSNPTVAQLGDSDALAVGDPVIAIGSPLGLAGTVTTGIVSAKNRPVKLSGGGSDTDAVIDAIQTDAAVNPGNSGGPLVDASGAVVGINSAIRTLGGESSGSIGLGFAIPMNFARGIAEQLIRTGSVQHATMGVNARSATDGVTDGAQVQNVQAGGPAAAAGIAEGDIITKVGDRTVGNANELIVAERAQAVGATVPVTLLRAGREATVNVTMAAV
ncbi:PDZ domain-containing protein [Nakamurella flava]|uniref:PDZ domain-containing protein n=1 Tax=Nakamurella flava TaxID=2576308 RepID=A0A4V6CW87_9ACTN|nr:PDZ domain-containing protein [Nakamurella flava]